MILVSTFVARERATLWVFLKNFCTPGTRVKTLILLQALLQVYQQIATNLFTSGQQVVFALLAPGLS